MTFSRRQITALLLAAPNIISSRSALGEVYAENFDLNGNEDNDSAPLIRRAIIESSKINKTLNIPTGNYYLRSKSFTIRQLSNIRVHCAPDVRFIDIGRDIVTSRGDVRQIPWGIDIKNCDSIEWSGGRFETKGSGLRGRSNGVFNITNIEDRRPLLGVRDIRSARFEDIVLAGNPGPGLNRTEWHELRSSSTEVDFEYPMNNALFRALRCESVYVKNSRLAPDECSREAWTFMDCKEVIIADLESHSKGNNFASLLKVIRCGDVKISGISVTDSGRGSLIDIIARNFLVKDVSISYKNGKLLDISREWGEFNSKIDYGIIENCRTTGAGIISATGRSSPKQASQSAISTIIIRAVRAFADGDIGSREPALFRVPTADLIIVEDCLLHNMTFSIPRHLRYDNYPRLEVVRTVIEWDAKADKAATTLRTANHSLYRHSQINGYNVDYPTQLTVSGPNPELPSHVFESCTFNNIEIKLECQSIFRDCIFNNSKIIEGYK